MSNAEQACSRLEKERGLWKVNVILIWLNSGNQTRDDSIHPHLHWREKGANEQ